MSTNLPLYFTNMTLPMGFTEIGLDKGVIYTNLRDRFREIDDLKTKGNRLRIMIFEQKNNESIDEAYECPSIFYSFPDSGSRFDYGSRAGVLDRLLYSGNKVEIVVFSMTNVLSIEKHIFLSELSFTPTKEDYERLKEPVIPDPSW